MSHDPTGIYADQVKELVACPVCAAQLGETCQELIDEPTENGLHVVRYRAASSSYRRANSGRRIDLDAIIEEQIDAHYEQLGGHIHDDGERGAFPVVPARIHDTIVAICRNVVASVTGSLADALRLEEDAPIDVGGRDGGSHRR